MISGTCRHCQSKFTRHLSLDERLGAVINDNQVCSDVKCKIKDMNTKLIEKEVVCDLKVTPDKKLTTISELEEKLDKLFEEASILKLSPDGVYGKLFKLIQKYK